MDIACEASSVIELENVVLVYGPLVRLVRHMADLR